MSFPDVLQRGNDFLSEYPRDSSFWNPLSKLTCLAVIGASKAFVYSAYKPKIFGLEKLDDALAKSKNENRGLLTIMNHMSVVDDPFLWGILPFRYYRDVDAIRWGLGASNVCFTNNALKYFFSLGKVLATERFGRGPFQGSIDAAIRILSPDDTLDLEYYPTCVQANIKKSSIQRLAKPEFISDKIKPSSTVIEKLKQSSPIQRSRPSWFHIFPEGFVLQLESPHSNSMRYFHWGVSRLVLESTKSPIILPIFSTGFEKIAPESAAESPLERFLPRNFRHEINVIFGDPINDAIIDGFRAEWRKLVDKHYDPANPFDLSEKLKFSKEAEELRSRIAATLREAVAEIRHNAGNFPVEDDRFKSPAFWKRFTLSEGESDPDIKFIGKNWAIRRLQKFLQDDFDKQVEVARKEEEEKKH
ncbi:lysophosphatidylcholine acyltransferase [Saccharomycopsis crataegensis]|uniref:Tafazzin family protein n=1 Tax=Saccharomycopsis crataegensis TaxID=43959 RepID=A0AAV5QWA7_9ASCO|nr:lysophosphatidylcholine acyltransferase [Saccharomycopsis crataegensis]